MNTENLDTGVGEVWPLREEAVAGVNGVNIVLLEQELTSDTQRYLWNKLAT